MKFKPFVWSDYEDASYWREKHGYGSFWEIYTKSGKHVSHLTIFTDHSLDCPESFLFGVIEGFGQIWAWHIDGTTVHNSNCYDLIMIEINPDTTE